MAACGVGHTVLLRKDGTALAFGDNRSGQCDIPTVADTVTFVAVAAGDRHTVLLCSDGNAIACGLNTRGQCELPGLDEGVRYMQVAAGAMHTVLLRSDGSVVACGDNKHGQCDVDKYDVDPPPLRRIVVYVAGGPHTTWVRYRDGGSCGFGKAYGPNTFRRMLHPDHDFKMPSYDSVIQVAVGRDHWAGVQANGCGMVHARRRLYSRVRPEDPPRSPGLTFTDCAVGAEHAVFLRSDGTVVASGSNAHGQCNVPSLPGGETWTAMAAAGRHTVLIRSDGAACAFGANDQGQCVVPPRPVVWLGNCSASTRGWVHVDYEAGISKTEYPDYVVCANPDRPGAFQATHLVVRNMAGAELAVFSVEAQVRDRPWQTVAESIKRAIDLPAQQQQLCIIWFSGHLLAPELSWYRMIYPHGGREL